MKKSWTRILAVAAVLVLALCVLTSCGDNTQAKIDEAVKTAQDAADKVKTELEGQVKDLTDKLTAAEESAKTAAEAAVKEKDEALAAAQEAADAAKTELEGQVKDLTDKLAAAEETAKTAAEAAVKEKDEAVKAVQDAADATKAELEGQVNDLTEKLTSAEEAAKTAAEAAVKEKDEAVKAVQDAADTTKAELEGKVTDLTKQLEDAEKAAMEGADAAIKNAQEAADAAKAELEGQVKDLTEKLAAAEEAAKTAAEAAVKEKEEAVAAAVAEAEAAAKTAAEEAAKTAAEAAAKEKDEAVAAAEKAGEDAKAELEAKIADLEKQIADAAAAVKEEVTEAAETVETLAEQPVMTYAEYVEAELDSEVIVETYVQATQSWYKDAITVYAASEDGAYFIYNMACSEEDAAKLVPGTKIKVAGYKGEWAGETEIVDAGFEFIEGEPFISEAFDMEGVGDSMILHQNERVLFKGWTIAEYVDMDGNATGAAFAYKDAVGKTDDLYFKATKGDLTINFCVEFYLCNNETDVYKAVEGLQIGDVVDIEAYLYWYEGPNPHVIGVTKAE